MTELPKFKNEEEIFKFFEDHSGADFMAGAEEITGKVFDERPKKEITTIRLSHPLKQTLKLIARSKGIRYQTLVNMWLTERTKEELRKMLRAS